jgi:hypothetical protein
VRIAPVGSRASRVFKNCRLPYNHNRDKVYNLLN